MLSKGKIVVFIGSTLIVIYGISAAFYGRVVAKDEAYKELAVFMEALRRINDDYVEVPDLRKVQEGAMRGLIDALDPYSSFVTKERLQEIEKRKANGSAGIGVVLSKRADVLYVVSTLEGGPAHRGGLRPGDYLISIDGVNVDDRGITEAESLLRGAAGSRVKVAVFRSARTKPTEVEIVREPDPPVSASSRMLEGRVGLLKLNSLASGAVEQLRGQLDSLLGSGAEKLVLDLRDCAEGRAEDGAEAANLFLREGMIYFTLTRDGERLREVSARREKFVTELPMVLLINGSTAGAAEIVAGALHDNKRATLVGERSFGMGSVQKQLSLRSGAVLTLSIAKMYTPSGKMIQDETFRNTGIKPDVQVPERERHQDLLVESYYDDGEEDLKYRQLQEKIDKEQLEKALEILEQGVVQKRAA